MNNILVDQEKLELRDTAVELQIESTRLNLDIYGTVTISEILSSNKLAELNITVHNESSLYYNKFDTLGDYTLEVNINQVKNSNCEFKYSLLAEGEVKLKMNMNLTGDNNKTVVGIRAASEGGGSIYIDVSGKVKEKTVENELIEDIKCLVLNDSTCTVIPNMLINTDEVMANHNVSIGAVSNDDIFYLKSKGISDKNAIKLIRDGFITNNLSLGKDDYTKIKEILNGR